MSLSERGTYERLTLSTQHGRTQLCDQPQDFGKEVSWDRDLGHLAKVRVAALALEAHGYVTSKDIYGKTEPAQQR